MTTSKTHPKKRRETLLALDQSLGPLVVGELTVSRIDLSAMGAQVAGKPVKTHRLAVREADQALLDSIRFSASRLQRYLRGSSSVSDSSAAVLFEFAALRSTQAAPLLVVKPGDENPGAVGKLDRLLRSVQKTNLNQAAQLEGMPGWVEPKKSRSLAVMGAGLEVYGYYSAINALAEAIKTGDINEAVVTGAELFANLTGTALELALEHLGRRLLENGHKVLAGFSASSLGQALRRGVGLFALVLTLPFDYHNAKQSLHKAANSTGKEALDHYVNAGFSIVSASVSVALGVAALAGFGVAGPLGIAAAAVLMFGAQLYAAVRQVDEIDDYIELSVFERLHTGWLAFQGKEPEKEIRERFALARMEKWYAQHLTNQAQTWLRGALRGTVQAVVNGGFEVRLSPVRHWKHRWNEAEGEDPYIDTTEPTLVDQNDQIDASSASVGRLPGVVLGQGDANSAVLWRLGGGNDDVKGFAEIPNIFQFGEGPKQLTGGARDDVFSYDMPTGTLDEADAHCPASQLRGEAGSDTLYLSNSAIYEHQTQGYAIDLQAGTVVRRKDIDKPLPHHSISLDSIENIATPAGVASQVKGSEQANTIIANGDGDRIEAAQGNDTVIVLGSNAWVDGGAGKDRYVLASNRGTVSLYEQDWAEGAVIEMRWPLSAIAHWGIQGCALVIVVWRGVNGELPQHVIKLEQLYTQGDDRRWLNKHSLLFLTEDGYMLEPILEPTLVGNEDVDVTVAVRAGGQDVSVDRVLNAGTFVVPHGRSTRCFIERGPHRKVVEVRLKSDATACVLYVDYSSQEILQVLAGYRVTLRRLVHFDSLTYSDVKLTISFTDGSRLVLCEYASDRSSIRTNVTSNIIAVSLKLDCQFVLVMNDGVSYRIQAAQQTYTQDRASPGFNTFDGSSALVKRPGIHGFFRPHSAKGVWLQSSPQKVVIPAPPHYQKSYSLMGRASTYEVVPSTGSTIYLSTPGALAKKSDASFWRINTAKLGELIERAHIVLIENTLTLGSVKVLLPPVKDPSVPLEQVSVLTNKGEQYDIRQDLGGIYLAQLDASPYQTVAEVWEALRRSRQWSTLMAHQLRVIGLELSDGTVSGVHYDSGHDCWGADLDPLRTVTSADLRFSGVDSV